MFNLSNIKTGDDFNFVLGQFQLKMNTRLRHRIYRKLQGLLDMNEPLPRALERLWLNASEGGKHPERALAVVIKEWLNRFRMGMSLAACLEGSLPSRDLLLIRAGEEAGALSAALTGILAVDESTAKMTQAIRQAISYPLFMILLLAGILAMLSINLVEPLRKTAPPKVFASIGLFGNVSSFVRHDGIYVLLFLGLFILLFVLSLPVWRGNLRSRLDRYPPWAWYRVAQGSSFLLGLSALLKAQVALKKALEILAERGSPWWLERVGSARQEVLRGQGLGEALRAGDYGFPDRDIATDLELLGERADVAEVLQSLTKEWLEDQIRILDYQASAVRVLGLAVIGGIIAWALLSIVGLTQSLANGGFK